MALCTKLTSKTKHKFYRGMGKPVAVPRLTGSMYNIPFTFDGHFSLVFTGHKRHTEELGNQ